MSDNKTGKTGATHPNWVGCYGNSGAINELPTRRRNENMKL
jgi:hypothetical protein